MKRATIVWTVFLVVLFGISAVGVHAASDKTVILFGGRASSEGEVSFLFDPADGESQEVKIAVLSGTNAKNVARDVHREFTLALGDLYEVQITGKKKQNVTITAKSKAGAFDVVLEGNTVGGLSIALQ